MHESCCHQRTAPGDIWPPTCVEVAGHTGPHSAKAEFATDGSGRLERVTWANEEAVVARRSLFDRGVA